MTVLNFNFVALLAYLLPLAGGVIALITKNGFISKIISTACFVAGAVLLFSIVAYSGIGNVKFDDSGLLGSVANAFLEELYKAIDETKGLGVGAIVGGILSIVARRSASSKARSQNSSNKHGFESGFPCGRPLFSCPCALKNLDISPFFCVKYIHRAPVAYSFCEVLMNRGFFDRYKRTTEKRSRRLRDLCSVCRL